MGIGHRLFRVTDNLYKDGESGDRYFERRTRPHREADRKHVFRVRDLTARMGIGHRLFRVRKNPYKDGESGDRYFERRTRPHREADRKPVFRARD